MRRRNLLFGLLAVTTMGGARAEQSRKAYRIAIAAPAGPVGSVDPTVGQAFINELRRLEYVEGDNFLLSDFPAKDVPRIFLIWLRTSCAANRM